MLKTKDLVNIHHEVWRRAAVEGLFHLPQDEMVRVNPIPMEYCVAKAVRPKLEDKLAVTAELKDHFGSAFFAAKATGLRFQGFDVLPQFLQLTSKLSRRLRFKN